MCGCMCMCVTVCMCVCVCVCVCMCVLSPQIDGQLYSCSVEHKTLDIRVKCLVRRFIFIAMSGYV